MKLTPYEERLEALLERAVKLQAALGTPDYVRIGPGWLSDVRAALDEGPGMEHGLEMLTSQVSGLIEGAPERLRLYRGCKACANPDSPPHRPSPNCESGKRPHCTCDTCF